MIFDIRKTQYGIGAKWSRRRDVAARVLALYLYVAVRSDPLRFDVVHFVAAVNQAAVASTYWNYTPPRPADRWLRRRGRARGRGKSRIIRRFPRATRSDFHLDRSLQQQANRPVLLRVPTQRSMRCMAQLDHVPGRLH